MFKDALLLILGYFILLVVGLGAPQAALGAAAGELSGKTVQPGAGRAPPPQPGLAGGGGAVAVWSTLSHGSKS